MRAPWGRLLRAAKARSRENRGVYTSSSKRLKAPG
jgi:hypothetical protein